jgi:hypothetical protein
MNRLPMETPFHEYLPNVKKLPVIFHLHATILFVLLLYIFLLKRIRGFASSARLGGMVGFELDRTRPNCVELERAEKMEIGFEKPMNYEEWLKSIELDRTLTPNFVTA